MDRVWVGIVVEVVSRWEYIGYKSSIIEKIEIDIIEGIVIE